MEETFQKSMSAKKQTQRGNEALFHESDKHFH